MTRHNESSGIIKRREIFLTSLEAITFSRRTLLCGFGLFMFINARFRISFRYHMQLCSEMNANLCFTALETFQIDYWLKRSSRPQ